MHQHDLLFELDPDEGALLRAVATIAKRGWSIVQLQLEPASTPGARVSARLERMPGAGVGDLFTLARQLRRLHDVREVLPSTQSPSAPRAQGARPW